MCEKIKRTPSSSRNVKLIDNYAHRIERQIREKTPKWPENDQFRKFQFLIKRFFGPSYTSFDAELQIGYIEITYRSAGHSVLELLTKKTRVDKRPVESKLTVGSL